MNDSDEQADEIISANRETAELILSFIASDTDNKIKLLVTHGAELVDNDNVDKIFDSLIAHSPSPSKKVEIEKNKQLIVTCREDGFDGFREAFPNTKRKQDNSPIVGRLLWRQRKTWPVYRLLGLGVPASTGKFQIDPYWPILGISLRDKLLSIDSAHPTPVVNEFGGVTHIANSACCKCTGPWEKVTFEANFAPISIPRFVIGGAIFEVTCTVCSHTEKMLFAYSAVRYS